jgi:hypothetical protein
MAVKITGDVSIGFVECLAVSCALSCQNAHPVSRPSQSTAPRTDRKPPPTRPPSIALTDASDLLPQYSDDEAVAFAKLAPSIIPRGHAVPRYKVLHSMNIDERRLRDRQVHPMMNVVVEVWQLSDHFDISWMSDFRTYRDTPIEDYIRPIYGVRVEPGLRSHSR